MPVCFHKICLSSTNKFTHKKLKMISYFYCNNLGNNNDYHHLLIDL